MSALRYTDLDAVHAHVWEDFETAAEDPGHPYRQLNFATVYDETPDLRTVVLRAADADARALQFHSDRRSRKVEALRKNDRIAWHVWDTESLEQVRLYGAATVHLDDDVAAALWASQSPGSLSVYPRPTAPGTPIEGPEDGLRPDVATDPVTEEDVASGRQYFAAIRTVIDRVEWLHLHPDGHYRARFDYGADEVEATWVVP
ncbi:pyridoxamine 5'-phosphate oxidase family protein [Salinibacter altiplanensis]|uniref:pyridoxamine 5'-phosphate oxidase family protein n=1 Tax=Salinibacter altiplanensis TaxID=1803181 RepID=UPI000C9ED6CB|nr:pyridoxamine 5'-phosphate oxidase family protein [Salinibacter altiplanensis]